MKFHPLLSRRQRCSYPMQSRLQLTRERYWNRMCTYRYTPTHTRTYTHVQTYVYTLCYIPIYTVLCINATYVFTVLCINAMDVCTVLCINATYICMHALCMYKSYSHSECFNRTSAVTRYKETEGEYRTAHQ